MRSHPRTPAELRAAATSAKTRIILLPITNEAIDSLETSLAECAQLASDIKALQQQDPNVAETQRLATAEATLKSDLQVALTTLGSAQDNTARQQAVADVTRITQELDRLERVKAAGPVARELLEQRVAEAQARQKDEEARATRLQHQLDALSQQFQQLQQSTDHEFQQLQQTIARQEGQERLESPMPGLFARSDDGIVTVSLPYASLDGSEVGKKAETALKVLKEFNNGTDAPIQVARRLFLLVQSARLPVEALLMAVSQLTEAGRHNLGLDTFDDFSSAANLHLALARRLPVVTKRAFYQTTFKGDKALADYIKEQEPVVSMMVALQLGTDHELIKELIHEGIPSTLDYARDNKWLLDILRARQPKSCTDALSILNTELRRPGALKEKLATHAMPGLSTTGAYKGAPTDSQYVPPARPMPGTDQAAATQVQVDKWRNVTCNACHKIGHIASYCGSCTGQARREAIGTIKRWPPRRPPSTMASTATASTATTAPTTTLPAQQGTAMRAPAGPTSTTPPAPTTQGPSHPGGGNWIYVANKSTNIVAETTGGPTCGLVIMADLWAGSNTSKRGQAVHLDTGSLQYSLIHPDAIPGSPTRQEVMVEMRGVGSSTAREAVTLRVQHPHHPDCCFQETFLVVEELPLEVVLGNATLERFKWERLRGPDRVCLMGTEWPTQGVPTTTTSLLAATDDLLDYAQLITIQEVLDSGILDHMAGLGSTPPHTAATPITQLSPEALEDHNREDLNEIPIIAEELSEAEAAAMHMALDALVDNEMPLLQQHPLKEEVRTLLHSKYFPVFRNELVGRPERGTPVSYGLDPNTVQLQSEGPAVYTDPQLAQRVEARLDVLLRNGIMGRVNVDLPLEDRAKMRYQRLVPRESKAPDGTILKTRLTYNQVRLNACIDASPMNTIQPAHLMFHRAAGAKCLGGMDECDSYFQYALDYNSQLLSGTWSPKGEPLYFKRMPQGYKFAPQILHDAKMKQYAGIPSNNIAWIFDDTALFTRGETGDAIAEFWVLLQSVLDTCLQSGTVLKPSKFKMFQSSLKREGMIYTLEGMKRDPVAVEAILATPPPDSISGVRGALGLLERYTKHQPALRLLEAPLHAALRKDGWTADTPAAVSAAWKEIVNAMAVDMLLFYPDYTQPFIWDVDSSTVVGIAGMVGQFQESMEGRTPTLRPIQFFSRKLRGNEPLLWATEMEIVGYNWALNTVAPEFSRFGNNLLNGDAASLANWDQVASTTQNKVVKRAMMELQHLRVAFQPVSRDLLVGIDWFGRANNADHTTADGRQVTATGGAISAIGHARVVHSAMSTATALVTRAQGSSLPPDVRAAQAVDPECAYLRAAVEQGVKSVEARKIFDTIPVLAKKRITRYRDQDPELKRFSMREGILMYERPPPYIETFVPYWPYELRRRTIIAAHDWAGSGHRALQETKRQIADRVFFLGMSEDISKHIDHCLSCLANKGGTPQYGGLSAIRLHNYRRMAYDLIGPLTTTTRGHRFWGTLLDMQSKYVWLKALRSKASLNHANFLFNVWLTHGMCEQLQIDGAKELVDGTMRELTRICNIHNFQTPAYMAIPNGDVERKNGSVGILTRALSNRDHDDWHKARRFIMAGLNNSLTASINATPFSLEFARDCVFPLDFITGTPSADKDVEELQSRAELARHWASLSLEVAKDEMEARYNRTHEPFKGRPGDLAMIHWPRKVKLDPFWEGPYKLIQTVGEAGRIWEVAHPQYPRDTFTVHVNRLKALKGPQDREFGATTTDPEYLAWTRSALHDAVSKAEADEVAPDIDIRAADDIEQGEWEVDTLLSHRDKAIGKGRNKLEMREYLVRYKGYSDAHNEWRPEEELLETCPNMVHNYLESTDMPPLMARVAGKRKVKKPQQKGE